MCPHTAAGEKVRSDYFPDKETVVVSTAHPAKFEQVVEPEIGNSVPVPESLGKMLEAESIFMDIKPEIPDLFES